MSRYYCHCKGQILKTDIPGVPSMLSHNQPVCEWFRTVGEATIREELPKLTEIKEVRPQ